MASQNTKTPKRSQIRKKNNHKSAGGNGYVYRGQTWDFNA